MCDANLGTQDFQHQNLHERYLLGAFILDIKVLLCVYRKSGDCCGTDAKELNRTVFVDAQATIYDYEDRSMGVRAA